MYRIAQHLADHLNDELSEGLGDLSQEFIDDLRTQLDQGIPGGPQSNSGELRDSLQGETKKTAEGIITTISTDCAYAPTLEFGSYAQAPKPFLAPTFQEAKERFMEGIKGCVNEALAEVCHD